MKAQNSNLKSQKIIIIGIIVFLLVSGGVFYRRAIRPEQVEPELTPEQKRELSLQKTKQAELQMSRNDYPGCEKLAQEAIDLDPENISAYILLGQSKYVQDKTKEAKDVYLAGLAKDPNNFQINFNLANVYRDLQEYELSAQYYEKTLEINSDDALIWSNYAFLFFLQEKWDKALEIYEQALGRFPDNASLKTMYELTKQKVGEK